MQNKNKNCKFTFCLGFGGTPRAGSSDACAAIASPFAWDRIVQDFALVRFVPMAKEDPDSVSIVQQQIDNCIQYVSYRSFPHAQTP